MTLDDQPRSDRMPQQEPRVLFIAFACEPGRGSEPGIGWGFVDEMSRRRPVWVIADEEFRVATQRYLATQHSQYPIHATFIGLPKLQWIKRWFLGMNIYYYLWQFRAARVGRQLHREVQFDLIQHVSFERYWMHSAGASIGPPFLFGPVGGGEVWPDSMKSDMSLRDRLQSVCWNIARKLMELDPFFRRTLYRTSAAIPSVEATKKRLQKLGVKTLDVMVCVAPKPELPTISMAPGPDETFRFISIGRLPKWKGCHLGIRAFAKAFGPGATASNRKVEYLIIGDGPEVESLKGLANSLCVEEMVHFTGDLPYVECLAALSKSGALVHPALRDSAGLVFESLMMGVPVICTDIGVPGVVVNGESGMVARTELGTERVVESIAETMRHWVSDNSNYSTLRQGAIKRIHEFNRESRGNRLDAIHLELIQQYQKEHHEHIRREGNLWRRFSRQESFRNWTHGL
jgi:glycosyltransferase involved in cell wall biosynthesis